MSPSAVVTLVNLAVNQLTALIPSFESITRASPGTHAQIMTIVSDVQQALVSLQGSENDAAAAKPIATRILDDLQAVTAALAALPLPPPGPQILLGLSMLIPTIRGLVGLVWPAKSISIA